MVFSVPFFGRFFGRTFGTKKCLFLPRPKKRQVCDFCSFFRSRPSAFCAYWQAVNPATKKILIIRFSSIGDIVQCLSVASRLAELNAEIHWVTRADLSLLLDAHPSLHRIFRLERREGFSGLLRLIFELRRQNYTHIYDAHNNLRSRLITWALGIPFINGHLPWHGPRILRRNLHRWKRFLLLRFHKDLFRKPASGQRDLLEALTKWGLSESLPPTPVIFCGQKFESAARARLAAKNWPSVMGLVPSAAYELKRWPIESFAELIASLPNEKFWIFGGPDDHFLEALVKVAPDRVENLAGKLNLAETAGHVAICKSVVANDTGVLHIAEQLGRPTIALMGPAPFGFPSRPTTKILERDLYCRPCSKHGQGPCVNPEFQKCLRDIRAPEVIAKLQTLKELKS